MSNLQKIIDTLKFYADRENYEADENPSNNLANVSRVSEDRGARANDALLLIMLPNENAKKEGETNEPRS